MWILDATDEYPKRRNSCLALNTFSRKVCQRLQIFIYFFLSKNQLQGFNCFSCPYLFMVLHFLRDNVRLPLTNISIIHSASVSMPAPTTCWEPEQVSSVSTQYQLVSTSINSFKVIIKLGLVGCLFQVTFAIWGRKPLRSVLVHLCLKYASIFKHIMTQILDLRSENLRIWDLEIWDLLHQKIRADILFSHNFTILLQTIKPIRFPSLTSYTKSLGKEKTKLSCTDSWNLSKVSPKFLESSFCSGKRKSGLVLWTSNLF